MNNKDKIINSIEKIRAKNNKNWMEIMRLAFKYAPKQASNLVKKINKYDKEISILIKKLSK